MSKYMIPEVMREDVTKAIARIEKKAARYGCKVHVEYGEPYCAKRAIIVKDPVTHVLHKSGDELVEVFDLDIDSDIVRKGEYQVIAKIEHLENGNIASAIANGEDIRPEWHTIPARCEHCNGKHGQKYTFIVRGADGSEKQVGRTCLKDYCGIDPEMIGIYNALTDLVEEDEEDSWGERFHASRVYDVVDMIANAMMIQKEYGFTPSSGIASNKMRLCEMVGRNVSEEEREAAKVIANGFLAMQEKYVDDVVRNIIVLVKGGYCKENHFGLLAYAPLAYERCLVKMAKDREYEAAHEKEKSSEWIGEIGKRQVFELSDMRLLTSWENDWGYTYLYKMVDLNGNVLVWYSSRGVDEMKKIKATVKDHVERNGVKETIVTRCVCA